MDEALQVSTVDAPSLGDYLRSYMRYSEEHGASDPILNPVPYAVEYYWARCFGHTILAMRFLSVLLGTASLAVLFAMVRMLLGDEAAVVSTALMAVSPHYIYYSQEIRAYAIILLLALLSLYSLLHILRSGAKRWWALHLLVNGLLPATHSLALLLLPAEGCFILLIRWGRPRLWLTWGVANMAVIVPAAAWILTSNIGELTSGLYVYAQPGLDEVPMLAYMAVGVIRMREECLLLDEVAAGTLILSALAAVLWLLRCVWRDRSKASGQPNVRNPLSGLETLILLAMWTVIPPLLLAVMSYAWKPSFTERYVLYAMPPVLIAMGGAFSALPRRSLKVGAAVLLAVLYTYQLDLLAHPLRSDWRSAAEQVRDEGSPRDGVIVLPNWQRESFLFYTNLPREQVEGTDQLDAVYPRAEKYLSRGAGAWVILWATDYDLPGLEAELAARGVSFVKTPLPCAIPLSLYHLTAGASSGP